MELVQHFVKRGFRVTFVNSDFTHKRVMNALSKKDRLGKMINMVSIPDGLEPWDDRNDLAKLSETMLEVMPGKLEELIENINKTENDKITCVLADENVGWALKVAEKMGIKRAAFWPAAAALLALVFSIPKLIEDKTINQDGTIMKNGMIHLSPTMPAMNTAEFAWVCIGDSKTQKILFEIGIKSNEFVKAADWIICNSAYELEPATFNLFPKILPIGPLASRQLLARGLDLPNMARSTASRLSHLRCIWELHGFRSEPVPRIGLGLELTNRPFLWVVRPDITVDTDHGYPKGFKDRVGTRGRMVSWAPQKKVLAHPSVACFMSHCGWNSIIEGVSNRLPFLCWPYFADQFLNQSYICDVWNVGLRLNEDKGGVVTKERIKNTVDRLLEDETFKARALDLQEKAVSSVKESGCSYKNLSNFIEWMKKIS
ncbi:hypothetical protein LguiB_009006 [Lonicera macranthoides]